MLEDQVKARDGRMIAVRCSRCGLLFLNIPGRCWRWHADHTWTHV
jgi:uncharacterized C2H2 Zn-finger protein